ncbi:MAG: 4Fe-4S dicluster domain-containing protein [Deltaproteobacteria bacterium]|nr:4Fe-4S dicluster domain-containing protein [Deltaproteobacteria bacterium]
MPARRGRRKPGAPAGTERLARRDFLKLLGVGAGAAVAGCGDERRSLYPYVVPAADRVPGAAEWRTTVCRECPAGCGVRARIRDGRVVKLEGNPEHPVNRGALCARGQGALLRLYGPRRRRGPQARTPTGWSPLGWPEARAMLGQALRDAAARGRGRVALLTGLEHGTLGDVYGRFARAFGGRHLQLEPHAPRALLSAHREVFGRRDLPRFRLDRADLVLALEADLFETFVSPVELARQVVGSGRPDGARAELICAGPRRGVTGILADHWLPIRPGTGGHLALALLYELHVGHPRAIRGSAPREELDALRRALPFDALCRAAGVAEDDVRRLAIRLAEARCPVVLTGGEPWAGPTGVAGVVAGVLLAQALGAYREALPFGASSALATVSSEADLRELLERARAGEIDVLLVAGADPVFDLPGGMDVAGALRRVPALVSLDAGPGATADLARLALPTHTPLEDWGDYAPWTGVVGLMQPVVAPLFDTRGTGDLLLELARETGVAERMAPGADSFETLVRRRWAERSGSSSGPAAERGFDEALRRGGDFGEAPPASVTVAGSVWAGLRALGDGAPASGVVRLAPFAPLRSGRGERAAGGWLDELPEPTTAAVWGAPAELHPDLAARLGVADGDAVELRTDAGAIVLPAVVRAVVHPEAVAVPLDGGAGGPAQAPRRLFGAEALVDGVGLAGAGHAVEVCKASRGARLFRETRTFEQDGRGIARVRQLDPARRVPSSEPAVPASAAGSEPARPRRWGMAIDLDRCTGCSACVVACQAENNVAVVGPAAVVEGREMAWLQLQVYYERDRAGRPLPLLVPMLCQHCAEAPCEAACPVFAARHTAEGLNAQVYDRCIGARACAERCPYRVRRFNDARHPRPQPLELQLNPDVPVRGPGIMEKCTFCVQRIREAEARARAEGRELRDGDVRPACAQTCPTGAIVFGDLLDPSSEVSRLARSDRAYRVLEHLGTEPGVTYLERVLRWRG